jgi:carnitine O-palmitoyltransferase 2
VHTKKFSELFVSKNPSNAELVSILRDCSKAHNQLTKEAAMGNGFDRHLFAMRYYAQKKGKLPDFYLDPSYKLINHNILSTSTLAHPAVLTGGFAPVVRDGFGLGYRILDNSLGACVSSYESRDLNGFVGCLSETFQKLKELMQSTKDVQKD